VRLQSLGSPPAAQAESLSSDDLPRVSLRQRYIHVAERSEPLRWILSSRQHCQGGRHEAVLPFGGRTDEASVQDVRDNKNEVQFTLLDLEYGI
jgi:hypothetical protein